MNKKGFIEELSKKLNLSKEECFKINDILEDIFIIGKNNKEKIISRIKEELKVSEEKADEIYNAVAETITGALKDKIKHPFKSLD